MRRPSLFLLALALPLVLSVGWATLRTGALPAWFAQASWVTQAGGASRLLANLLLNTGTCAVDPE